MKKSLIERRKGLLFFWMAFYLFRNLFFPLIGEFFPFEFYFSLFSKFSIRSVIVLLPSDFELLDMIILTLI